MRHRIAIALAFATILLAGAGSGSPTARADEPLAGVIEPLREPLLIAVRGTGIGYTATIAQLGLTDFVLGNNGPFDERHVGCFDFEAVEVGKNGKTGDATICLWTTVTDNFPILFGLREFTFFTFSNGSLTTRTDPTLARKLLEDGGSYDFTHIFGSSPTHPPNEVVQGTGKFRGASGVVNSFGFIDLSAEGQITVDATYLVDPR